MKSKLLALALAAGSILDAPGAGPTEAGGFRIDDFARLTQSNGAPAGWRAWSPREEIRPRFAVARSGGRAGGGALRIETRDAADFGAWRTRIDGLAGGHVWRFSAWYRGARIQNERRSVIARLEWLDRNGRGTRPPDYALDVAREGRWTRVEYTSAAPSNACSLDLQLSLGFDADASVLWDEVVLEPLAELPERPVRALTVFNRPRGTRSAAESVEQFCRLVEGAAAQRPDIVCLPEGITVVGTGKDYAEVSETIPGPTTQRLGELARKLNSHVAAGIYERAGSRVYNTAVLLGRKGELVGAYRKTHLPREEWEKGITPGDRYPVFETDLGKVGLMICWDLQFPEPARALAAQGAEILLLPIWGGSEVLARARAIENSVFLVSSTYDMRSFIVDPAGQVLGEALPDAPVVCAELRLGRPIYQPWLGNMKTRAWKERRPDLAVPEEGSNYYIDTKFHRAQILSQWSGSIHGLVRFDWVVWSIIVHRKSL